MVLFLLYSGGWVLCVCVCGGGGGSGPSVYFSSTAGSSSFNESNHSIKKKMSHKFELVKI